MAGVSIPRLLAPKIEKASRETPVLVLVGARQRGKTHFLKNLQARRKYVSLRDIDNRTLAQEQPEDFIRQFPPPVFIDDCHYAPNIFPAIKRYLEGAGKNISGTQRNGLFWMAASGDARSLMESIQASLGEHAAVFPFFGLTLSEIQGNPRFRMPTTTRDLFALIIRGTKPALCADSTLDSNAYYASYIESLLEKEFRPHLRDANIPLFYKFMRLLASRVGGLLNMAEFSQELGVSIPTIKEWLGLLEKNSLVFFLQPYFKIGRKRLIKTPKTYFPDTGLTAYLLRGSAPSAFLAESTSRLLFENWVISETMKSYFQRGEEPRLYFWRTKDGLEFPLLRENGGKLSIFDIALTPTLSLKKGEGALERKVAAKKIFGAELDCYGVISASDFRAAGRIIEASGAPDA
jgi:hypothetical protein